MTFYHNIIFNHTNFLVFLPKYNISLTNTNFSSVITNGIPSINRGEHDKMKNQTDQSKSTESIVISQRRRGI